MTSSRIRREFIDFFVQRHGHTFVPSSPVVPHDDATLLFANAGMNQFKPYFLGTAKAKTTRVANTQKCIRAGGKHNDLDDVGISRRHHTFFEMLGNWSFGDYFKQGAIEMAWELLTKVWHLDPRRLHVTVYKGNPADGVPADDEAAELWRRIAGLPENHIHRFVEENFWEMGETGPCGPCTEIFIDRTPDFSGAAQVNGTDPRVMEIWNLVFIQYNRQEGRKLTPLPQQHVDTGMGLERICQVLGGFSDNYATDLFTPLFAAIADLSGHHYHGTFPTTDANSPMGAENKTLSRDIAFRVIADHIRALTFALTDGALPGNEGRGYVLRRILRRAVRFGRQNLGLTEPFLHQLVPVVLHTMQTAFPELSKNPGHVADIIKSEEISFSRTLDRGIELFQLAADEARSGNMKGIISAESAFKLHDTYGFPIDLTQVMAREQGLAVDVNGYEACMEEARHKARSGGKTTETALTDLPPDVLARLANENVPNTEDRAKYKSGPIKATVAAIWNGRELVDHVSASTADQAALILDQTNFYAQMGGQIGDSGSIVSGQGDFAVETAHAVGCYILHLGKLRSGRLQRGDSVTLQVHANRSRIEQNHTGTHLANWALREVLGEHVQQKGSLVDAEKLRFDFLQPQPLQEQQIQCVEDKVHEVIARRWPVYTAEVLLEEARRIFSLRAVFGEKYPEHVRVVSIGVPVAELLAQPEKQRWREFSIELCGGTHLADTGQAGDFVIVAEESVSKGIRRIVAYTGEAAAAARRRMVHIGELIAVAEHAAEDDLSAKLSEIQHALDEVGVPVVVRRRAQTVIRALQERIREQARRRQAPQQSSGASMSHVDQLLAAAEQLGQAELIVADMGVKSADELRATMDAVKRKRPQGMFAILLASTETPMDKQGNPLPAKVNLLAAVGDSLISKLKAGDWIRVVAPVVGGSGGGRPQLAMAGGKQTDKIVEALAAGHQFAHKNLQ